MGRFRNVVCGVALLMTVTTSVQAQAPNAADQYTQALKDAHLDEVHEDDLSYILANGYRPKVVVDKSFDDNQKAFGELSAGSHIARCRFLKDVEAVDRYKPPNYDQISTLALMYVADGLRLFSQGKLDDSVDALLGGVRMGLQLQQDKVILARTKGLALQMAAFNVTLKWLQREHPPLDLLKKHLAEVQNLQKLQVSFDKTVTTEQAWTNASVSDLTRPSSDNRAFADLTPKQRAKVQTLVHDEAARTYTQIARATAASDFEAVKKVQAEMAKEYNSKDANRSVEQLAASRMLEVLVPNFSSAWQQFRVAQTELNALPVLFALKAWQTEHHAYPKALTSLVPSYLPAVPKDPFGTGPFKYKLTASGCQLYSVGPDGRDDGGKAPLLDLDHYQGKDMVMAL